MTVTGSGNERESTAVVVDTDQSGYVTIAMTLSWCKRPYDVFSLFNPYLSFLYKKREVLCFVNSVCK